MNDTTFQGDGKVAYVPVVVNTKLKKPITNADRIRSMTDEELAGELLDLFAAFYEVEWSKEVLLDWLRQEAKDA